MDYKSKSDLNIKDNKKINFQFIDGMELDDFRLFEKQTLNLGKRLTIISGRNGSLKSTVMGLLTHPFKSVSKSINGEQMNTEFSKVFRLSPIKDNAKYLYHLKFTLVDETKLIEPIHFYYQESTNRFRIVPSGRKKGDGFFNLPSLYISLKRLFPLIETDNISKNPINYSDKEKSFISDFYQSILLRSEFSEFENYKADFGSITKNPKGPSETALYDVHTLSSGEDNLSTLADTLISFMRIRDNNIKAGNANLLTGILAIDEIEASLHPIAQINLIEFLISWSRDYHVQVILNTHSLYLIQQVIIRKEKDLGNGNIKLNFITNRYEDNGKLIVLENPNYQTAYSELTLTKNSVEENIVIKPKILCEDDLAELLIKRILKSYKNFFEFSHTVSIENNGTSKNLLKSLSKNFPKLLNDSMSIIVFDADVKESELHAKEFSNQFILPSLKNSGFAVEKEIIVWVLSLDNGDKLFKELKKSKEHFKQSFRSCKINLSDDYEKHSGTNISSYKNWQQKEKQLFNMLLTRYVNENADTFIEFREEIIDAANLIFEKNSLPGIK